MPPSEAKSTSGAFSFIHPLILLGKYTLKFWGQFLPEGNNPSSRVDELPVVELRTTLERIYLEQKQQSLPVKEKLTHLTNKKIRV